MQNGGQRNCQSGNMSQCVEVCRAGSIAHPQAFLTCGFEAGIVTLTLRPQGVSPFKIEAAAVNGKPVIVWNGLVFRAAPVFLPIVPVFVVLCYTILESLEMSKTGGRSSPQTR